MFKPVSSRADFVKNEEDILKWWAENDIFKKSIEHRKGNHRFNFYEGPPTANGRPGIHHVLARVFKDVIPRYQTMKGKYVPRIGGWDTHGLPVELEVEKKLGFSGKAQIEKYGIAAFNAKCKDSVFTYLRDWEAMTRRIGFWVDLDNAYITMKNSYIETVWWAIKQMWDRGLVYQGYRVTPHCPRCGTSLSSHEVALGYQDDTEDPSVFVKFKIDPASLKGSAPRERLGTLFGGKPAHLLAWTTTPWTLPGNTALAVSADAEYAVIAEGEGYLIMASARMSAVGFTADQVVDRLAGADLVEIRYMPLFNPHEFGIDRQRFEGSGLKLQPAVADLTYRVIATDFVTMEDGTGIVHVAPAYGEADYQAGQDNGLDFVHMVDLQGHIGGRYPFTGKFVKQSDPLVLQDLESRGLLFRKETIRHTYPFCWRCNTPLLYYAKQTWYIKTTAVKDELIKGNEQINWFPEYIKEGRFGDWLRNNVDWAFSRERYWGTPLPVWRCQQCGSYECIGSVADIKSRPGSSGLVEPLDLHRPFVDDITFSCSKCSGITRRVPEVIDCWFDSGAMPISQYHYPFENNTLLEDGRFPADFICEAVDQTRGWFYSLHAISTLLFGRPSYNNVICLGHILDVRGEKMSKTRGNVVEPDAVLNKYGADALRWYLYTSSPPGNVRRFDVNGVLEVTRRFMLTLWNCYSFFVTYANIDNYVPGAGGPAPAPSELDRWITSALNQLVVDVDNALAGYDPTTAGRKIETFIDELSNWYVRRSRRRFWKSESDTDKQAAYDTMYACLTTVTRVLAPLMPFMAEELYQNLVRAVNRKAPVSVHMTDFPAADTAKIDSALAADVKLAMAVSSLGRAARSEAGIKVRQPLPIALVVLASGTERKSLEKVKSQVIEELNVRDIEIVTAAETNRSGFAAKTDDGYTIAVPTVISDEYKAEGMAREIVHRLQTMRRSAGFEIADYIVTYYQGEDYIQRVMTDWKDYIKQETLSRDVTNGIPDEGVYSEEFKIEGKLIKLGVRKQQSERQ